MRVLDAEIFRSRFFVPFSFLWESILRARRFAYKYGPLKQSVFAVPIISVGNLTFGGTGKTPFGLWLASFLHNQGKNVAICTRGYKGSLESSGGLLQHGESFRYDPSKYGDEAVMLAKNLESGSVIIGKDRSKQLRHYLGRTKPEVVILDDGHQHLKIHRDLNIVLFDAVVPISHYKVAPSGHLREGLSALRDADAIVISRSDLVNSEKLNRLENFISAHTIRKLPFSHVRFYPKGIFDYENKKVMDIKELKGRKVIGLVALASPYSFFYMLGEFEANLVGRKVFPDHHHFEVHEIEAIEEEARAQNAIIICSEKDIVKIRTLPTPKNILYLGIEVKFLKGEQEIKDLILKHL